MGKRKPNILNIIVSDAGRFVTHLSQYGTRAHSTEYPDALQTNKREAQAIARKCSTNDEQFKAIGVDDYAEGIA